MTTIPVTTLRPGDLVDTSNAVPPGPIVRVRAVATWGERTYLSRYDTGYLVPDGYYWPAGAHVDVYSRA
jgi:hypothetical protein